MVRKPLVSLVTWFCFISVFALGAPAQSVHAAGVVGDGTASSCTESALLAALNGGGAVTFQCGVSPVTIVLTQEYILAQDTTIDGGGLVTLSGGDNNRVLVLTSGLKLTLQNLTIANGLDFSHGGAVLNAGGILTIDNSRFYNSLAGVGGGGSSAGGAIYNSGILTVTDSTFSQNRVSDYGASGGAIYNSGPLKITNSTFVSNDAGGRAGSGGAIWNAGALTVINSTFFANRATADAPPSLGASGGAISNSGTLTVMNSTITANVVASSVNQGLAGSGIMSLDSAGGATLINSIVANNIGAANCAGTFSDGGGNLRWPKKDTTCPGMAGDPVLGPLADNGGKTLTRALYSTSRAIDLVSATHCTYEGAVLDHDQRWAVRPMDGDGDSTATCDAGAYEYDPAVCVGVAPYKPQLHKPKDGAAKFGQEITFNWDDSACATFFDITIRQYPAGDTRVHRAKGLTRSRFQVKGLEKDRIYFWRVKACNGTLCSKSDWSHFTIQP